MRTFFALVLGGVMMPYAASAKQADYGQIELNGLARETSWPLNRPGESYAMVCNLDRETDFLAIRSGPGNDMPMMRGLKRLATVTVDTRQRQGRWVRVLGAHRSFSIHGVKTTYKKLPVSGWALDGYLCSFTDYPESANFNDILRQQDNLSTSDNLLRNRRTRESQGRQVSDRSLKQRNQARKRRVDCEWDNGSGITEYYSCTFSPYNNDGSFSVMRNDGYDLNLTIVRRNVGRLNEYLNGRAGLRFGLVYRSHSDPACWETESGRERLCAR